MSALCIVTTPECVVMATDGGAYGEGGALSLIGGKVILLPEASTIITGRGLTEGLELFKYMVCRSTERLTFDRLLGISPGILSQVSTSFEQIHETPAEPFELFLAGWSESRQAHEAWGIRSYETEGVPEGTLFRLEECFMTPPLPAGMARKFGLRLPGDGPPQWPEDPIRYAASTLAAMRFCPATDLHVRGQVAVGAFVQVSRVSRHRVVSEIVQEWPDPVGEPVDPDASLWGPDGEVTAERVFGPMGHWEDSRAA